MRFSDAIDKFRDDLEAQKKSPRTYEGYRHDLLKLRALLPRDTVYVLTLDVLREAMRTWSVAGLAQNTLKSRQTAIRAFCRWGLARRLWTENPAAGLDLIPQPDALPRPFEAGEVARLFALELPADEDLARALLFFTGLRVSSICALTIGAISLEPPQLRAVGKKGRLQAVELHPALADKLAAHLITRPGARSYEPLLARQNGLPVRPRAVQRWMQAWGRMTDPPVLHCTPHRARHTFGSELLDATANLRTVQEALGHRSVQSTQIYTRVRSQTVREAILRLPWGKNPETGT